MFRIPISIAAAASLLSAGVAAVFISKTGNEPADSRNIRHCRTLSNQQGTERNAATPAAVKALVTIDAVTTDESSSAGSFYQPHHTTPTGPHLGDRVNGGTSVVSQRPIRSARRSRMRSVANQHTRSDARNSLPYETIEKSAASRMIPQMERDHNRGGTSDTTSDGTPRPAPVHTPRLPIAFSLPDNASSPGSREEELIYETKLRFSNDLNPPDQTQDPASETYASRWRVSVESHDDFLRRTLGWERFNQLSALAAQRAYQEAHGMR
jgi:hypothetical protein